MDPTFILLIVALGAFIVFQIFQGRKRRRDTEERQSKFLPGAEVMTNYGLYGTILTLDDEKNLATIETTPGTVLKIHRQTILKIADYDDVPVAIETETEDVEDDRLPSVGEVDETAASGHIDSPDDRPASNAPRFSEPQFGERVDGYDDSSVQDDRPGTDKPASRPFKKGDE